ncbi:nitrate reductase associated protein [Thermosynechococcaceae cyanobacterium BACA0444]|uniref:Nitrate reductase associated protein n=1 Tax=Pseudocalidococcus azoricus BACA0444 TaxID=2918990 RepID=A0AAE4FQV4_9CYAN|nr:nitrate reductase associated protein [Pseudocalidococcus azoricus]MDS3860506.1 nitrate reductase associated protein [Pseudocalidococcus azoricus BACA0444]
MFFHFETDFVDSLRCIPMVVRYRLDSCGVKLKLNHWHQFSMTQRQYLIDCPFDSPEDITAYAEKLQAWVTAYTGTPAKTLEIPENPAWFNTEEIPAQVTVEFIAKTGCESFPRLAWAQLTPLQRFALIKLSQPGHENRNFLPALQEFGILAKND